MSRWPLLIFRSVGQRSGSKVKPILYMLGKGDISVLQTFIFNIGLCNKFRDQGSIPVETYSRNWIWPRSIFIIGSVWRWNWYCTHINLNNVILWGIIPICKIFAKTWHFLFCFGVCYSFWPFALTRECALHLRPCEKTRKTYFAGGLAGFSKTICTVPE